MTNLSLAEGSTYAHVILDATQRFADQPAMRWKCDGNWKTTTYAELRSETLSLAAALKTRGLVMGDRVCIWLETCRDWIVCDLAIQVLGGVTVPIYHTLPPEKAGKIIKDSEARALISTSERLQGLKRLGYEPSSSFLEVSLNADGPTGALSLISLMEEGRHNLEKGSDLIADLESPRVRPDDLSAIIYTSGTTGEPKGVMLTHRSIVENARSGVKAYLQGDLRDDDVSIFLHLPMAHVVGRNGIETMALTCGAMLAIAEPEREKLVSNLRSLAPTDIVTVPYVLSKFHTQVLQRIEQRSPLIRWLFTRAMALARRCRVEPVLRGGSARLKSSPLLSFYDRFFFRSIRGFLGGRAFQIITGAAHISPETLEFFWAIGIPLYEAYGMTETTSLVTYCSKSDVKLMTVGRPAEGMEVRLASDGEILIRGVGLMKGYWKRPEDTSAVIDAEGWYHTGDIGSLDEEGYLRILDRKKEIFVLSTGKNVAPQSVENTLKLSPFVENACVFGDKRNYMTALIVPEWTAVQRRLGLKEKPTHNHPDVQKLFAGEVKRLMEPLPDYEVIKRFALIDKPFSIDEGLLTPTLKLRRKEIEQLYHQQVEDLYSGPQSNFWFF